MSRDPDSIHFEAEYLHALNVELQRLLGHISDVAQELAGVPVATLALVLAPPTPESVEAVTAAALRALEHLAMTQKCAIGLGDLLGGRIIALRRESGLDETPDDP